MPQRRLRSEPFSLRSVGLLRDFFANPWVADGDLVTGQNQNAGPMVARLMMERVLSKPRA